MRRRFDKYALKKRAAQTCRAYLNVPLNCGIVSSTRVLFRIDVAGLLKVTQLDYGPDVEDSMAYT